MKKIPTIFQRDWNGDRSLVVNEPNPECSWVFEGEGVATLKLDGTCCLVRDGVLYKRRELKSGDNVPDGFELADTDDTTGKRVGWVPVGNGPDDRWHREAAEISAPLVDGTYELLGPKIQGNPENMAGHILFRHAGVLQYADMPRDFDGMKRWLTTRDIEGVVFHHSDGRMAKIKKRDFGLKREVTTVPDEAPAVFFHAHAKCEHVWDGGWVEIDNGGSASCSKCGRTAFSVSMAEGI